MGRMKSFSELPDRYEVRCRIVDAGCDMRMYCTNGGITVAVARGRESEVIAACNREGLEFRDACYFPLGSDQPPEEYRHWYGRYTPENGFPHAHSWKMLHFNYQENER